MGQLDGKVAIVTGGGSGIGRALAEAHAREGAKVVVADVADDDGNETVAAIGGAGGEALYVRTDVADPEQCRRLVDETVARFGGLHVACNNAGIGGESAPVADYSVEGWQRVIGINLNAALEYATQGIRVNSIGPGFISTPLIAELEEDKATNDMLVSLHPLGRLGEPEEVAELALFLSTDKASFMTGAYVPVEGGYLAR